MKMTRRLAVAASLAVALLGALLGTAPASADSIGFDITVPNAALVPFPTPYAHVDVNRTNSTNATITFTGLTTGAFTYSFGAVNAVDVNVNAATFSVAESIPTLSFGGSGNVSEFGTLNATLNNSDGFPDRLAAANFTVTNTSGTWASASDVLTPNSKGFSAAAHIFVTAVTCEDACVTGFAGDPGLTPVPEPVTMLLFGTSLLGAGIAGRKKLFR